MQTKGMIAAGVNTNGAVSQRKVIQSGGSSGKRGESKVTDVFYTMPGWLFHYRWMSSGLTETCI